ncbi:MAG: thiol oxidoreductase [Pseudomonadota bacterium]|nr:thiol oxidoreductase [Pseudomonadota bacterium]
MLPAAAVAGVPAERGPEAYSQAVDGLDAAQSAAFLRGRALFHQVWVVAPSLEHEVEGLGPLYNAFSCSACHPGNGRGHAPDGPGERMRSMLVRLSVPGHGPHGGPRPSAAYGDQFNEQGIPGVPGEGRARLSWQPDVFRYPDGSLCALRRPRLQLTELAYGPMRKVQTSARIAPAVYGTGLLDAVPDAELLTLARRQRPDHVRGRVNLVWNAGNAQMAVGRFGWKANVPHLTQQVAAAFLGDMGITSGMFPQRNCTSVQQACRQAPAGRVPQLDPKQLADTAAYVATLAVPPASVPSDARGEAAFTQAGCANCHLPELHVADRHGASAGGESVIHPYTDLLLHDMGAALADGRPDFRAGSRAWRTAPLWGIGLAREVDGRAGFLHDGRARSLEEAVLWHGGEAQAARQRFVRLSRADRLALLDFVAGR